MNTVELTEAIILAAGERGHLLVRNNSGRARFLNDDGSTRWVQYGVGPKGGGGADLIGLRAPDGKMISIEVKVGADKPTDAQIKWRRWVEMRGGLAGVARTVEDAIEIMERK